MCLGPSAVAVMKGKLEEDNIFISIKFQLNFSQTPICTVRERESTQEDILTNAKYLMLVWVRVESSILAFSAVSVNR